jgi:hypothetical protein
LTTPTQFTTASGVLRSNADRTLVEIEEYIHPVNAVVPA